MFPAPLKHRCGTKCVFLPPISMQRQTTDFFLPRVKAVIKSVVFAALALSMVDVARAAENRFDGVFVTNPDMCDLVGEDGTMAIFGNDIAILDLPDGLHGWELSCYFKRIAPDGDGLKISARCMNRDVGFDAQIYLSVYEQNRIEFSSPLITGVLRRGNDDKKYRFLFSRCDQVKELKLD